jgi:predicted dehydrogenase
MTDKARMAIIGAGWWATQFHIPGLLSYDRAEIVGVADKDPAKLQAVKGNFGIGALYSDYHEMLQQAQPQGVVLVVPHAVHYPIARDVLNAGVNLMMEKPMTLKADEAWELVDLARRKDLRLTVGYPWNYTSHANAAREAVRSGRIGEIQLVTGLFASMVIEYLRGNPEAYRRVFKFPVTGPGEQTYSNPEVAGGGQGHLQVTHLAGLMFWITGLRAAEVFAFMEKYDLQVDLVDAIAVRFDNRAVGTLASSGNIAPDQQLAGGETNEIRVYGTKGSIVINPIPGQLKIYSAHGDVQEFPQLSPEDSYPARATARNLADLILGGNETCGPGEIGAITVDLLDAAYQSAQSGKKVKLPSREL